MIDNAVNKETGNGLSALLADMSPLQIGTLAFNLGAIAWVGLNVSFRGLMPFYMPNSYIHPNILNIICGGILLFSCYLAYLAIKNGSLIPAFITLTFVWSMIATVVAQFSG